jgi:hypothetical protein
MSTVFPGSSFGFKRPPRTISSVMASILAGFAPLSHMLNWNLMSMGFLLGATDFYRRLFSNFMALWLVR